MSNYQEVKRVLTQMAGQRNQIIIPKVFCRFMGSFEGGAFLNQLIFWSDKGDGEWFYKPYQKWQEEIMITEYQWRKAVRYCEEQGFLETKLKKVDGSPTMHFHFLFDKFMDSFIDFCSLETEISQNGNREITESIETEISQKPIRNRSLDQMSSSRWEEPATAPTKFSETKSPDKKLGAFDQAYHDIIGIQITSHLSDQIKDWATRIPIEYWTYALKEAADNGKRHSWRYIETILHRVELEGLPEKAKEGKSPGAAPQEEPLDPEHWDYVNQYVLRHGTMPPGWGLV